VSITTLRLRVDPAMPLKTKEIENILKDAVLFSNIIQSTVDFKQNF